jgi:bifunctional non-homologous end joining protein LigD
LPRIISLGTLLDGAEGPIRFVDYLQGHGPDFLEACRQRGLEGVVSKRCQSLYAGRRTADWLKTKCLREAEFVVGGFVPKGRRGVASLLLGWFDDQARLVYAGSVSVGVLAAPKELAEILAVLARSTRAFARTRQKMDRASRWIEPRLIASVKYLDWTADGLLRQPVLQGLRPL